MIRSLPPVSLLILAFVIAGCGGKSQAQAGVARKHTVPRTSTPTPVPAPDTPTTQPDPPTSTPVFSTATPTAVPATSSPTPFPTKVAPTPARLIYAQLRPDTVVPGGALNGSVQTSGNVAAVTMYLSAGPGAAGGPSTYALSRSSPGNWVTSVTAPTASGTYHFTISLTDTEGKKSFFDDDGWNVSVSGPGSEPTPTTAAAVESLPDDIPLSPPFSWGNPVAATFTAAGQTINGSEVVSNSRPDVPASAVAQFYEIRLPRSGWSVDTTAIPPAGATSFTITGTQGNRVCLVEYTSGVVQVFYGES